MILHIPHSSRVIPEIYRNQFVLTDDGLTHELDMLTDAFTDELFEFPNASSVVSPVSRVLVDVERFLNDDDESMSKAGMGAIYTRTVSGKNLRRALQPDESCNLISKYYDTHHNRLQECVEGEMKRCGGALIVDCHSFPNKPLPCHKDQSPITPDFCIGTDGYHTPADLVATAEQALSRMNFSVQIDRPFPGTLVPMKFYKRDQSVASIMIEVNRRLYMNEDTVAKNDTFSATKTEIQALLGIIHEFQQAMR
jgi:N-formylglutamate deformylase